ncbi:MAG TPA: hypothetical protein VJL28_13955 [Gemmatimonadaceae bacterium]|nr:hypothetical protein [Gemmatimonadaceae bacterium]
MDTTFVALRLVHILCAVYWAGTILFVAIFLEPAVRGAGPAGVPVMQGLHRLGHFNIMPVIALLALLSGVALLWMDSGGFTSPWMGSPQGAALSLGGLAGVLAFLVGMFVMRPTALRMMALGAEAAKLPEGPARDAAMAPMGALRQRSKTSVRWTAGLLFVAAVTMAVARYLG